MFMGNEEPKLIISDSETDANIFYCTKFYAPDQFAFIQNGEKKIVVVSDLELDRAKSESRVDMVLPYTKYEKIAKKQLGKEPSYIDVIAEVLFDMKIKKVTVPWDFYVSFADDLRKKGFKLVIKKDPFFDSREIKCAEEVNNIIMTQRGVESALQKAVDYLKKTVIKNGFLFSKRGKKVTSEFIREMINVELLKNGFIAKNTIVSCGEQSAVPHNMGEGDLVAHKPIVIDIFPKDEKSGYYADMTRTIVRGKASTQIKKMFKAVVSAQELAFVLAKDGAMGDQIHRKVLKHLKDLGFETGKKNGRMQGFFHGTGHGVGLDVHELPRIGKVKSMLKSGHVVTVEPGLYYPGVGGVRMEDMILIADDKCVNLTGFPKVLEI